MKKSIVGVAIFILFCGYNFTVVSGNWGCVPLLPGGCANCNGGGDGIGLSSIDGMTLGQYVMEGTAYYLQSHSDFQLFLKKIELAEGYGIDFDETRRIIDSAFFNMLRANDLYYNLYESTLLFPNKKEEFVKLLRSFNYEDFKETHGLISSIFCEVQSYLESCDVHGVYKKMFNDTNEILTIIIQIKGFIDENKIPEYHLIWKCNQSYSSGLLFGQYVSMVLYDIK